MSIIYREEEHDKKAQVGQMNLLAMRSDLLPYIRATSKLGAAVLENPFDVRKLNGDAMNNRILSLSLAVLLSISCMPSVAEDAVDPAPSGVERNEIYVDPNTGTAIGMPGRDSGEVSGNVIDFTEGTDAGTADSVDDFDPDTTTIIYESEGD